MYKGPKYSSVNIVNQMVRFTKR